MTPDTPADRALAEAWCQPMGCGKHTPRVFLIRFEDTEVGDLTFTDEGEARDMFVKLNQNWNCYLMASLPLIPRPAEPRRCAECDCEGGEMECNWMRGPADPAQAAQVGEPDSLIERLRGRALFLRHRGEIKTPGLLEQAAARIAAAQEGRE